MIPVTADTCEGAWLLAAEHLAASSGHFDYNMIVEITNPVLHTEGDYRLRKTVDVFLRQYDANPVTTVAGTIFPAAEYLRHGPTGVYEIYPNEVYPNIGEPHEWGRYAYRLVRWPPDAEKPINPLKTVVEKISSQLKGGQRMRACYELTLTDSAMDLQFYDPERDGRRLRGGPCLSHVTFKLGPDDTLYLTAMYRSHSYVARALGNFLGLADLQAFVCDQTGLSPGPLVCVSSYARLDTDGDWSMSAALELVQEARARSEQGSSAQLEPEGDTDAAR